MLKRTGFAVLASVAELQQQLLLSTHLFELASLFFCFSFVPLLIFFSVNLGGMSKSSERVVICFSQDTFRALAKGRTVDQLLKRLLRDAVSPKEFVVNNAQLLPLPTIEEQDEDESVTVSSSDSVGPGSNHEEDSEGEEDSYGEDEFEDEEDPVEQEEEDSYTFEDIIINPSVRALFDQKLKSMLVQTLLATNQREWLRV